MTDYLNGNFFFLSLCPKVSMYECVYEGGKVCQSSSSRDWPCERSKLESLTQTLFVAAPQIKRGHSHNAALLQKQINTSSDRRCASAPALLSPLCSLLLPPLPRFGPQSPRTKPPGIILPCPPETARLKETTAELLGLSSQSHNRCSGLLGDWENSSECFRKAGSLEVFFGK